MPHISMTIPETEQSISRPVVVDIVAQVRRIAKITNDSDIYFPGDNGNLATPSSTLDDPNQDRDARFEFRRAVFVSVEEVADVETAGSTATTREEHAPIFEDTELGVRVTPIYSTTNVRVTFRYRTTSVTEAKRWNDDMKMRVSQLRDVNLHSVTYHFGVPPAVEELIAHIYDKREAVSGYGEELGKYFADHSTERMTVVADAVNKNKILAVAETQGRIQGLFEFQTFPDKPERDDKGFYEVNFVYKFNYEKPIGMAAKYPVMIHNQLLDNKWIYFDQQKDPNFVEKRFSKSLYAFYAFEMESIMNDRTGGSEPYLRLPPCDDYVIPQVPQGTATAIMMLTEVDADKHYLVKLDELGDYAIDPDIMQFIREVEWPYICKQFQSVLHLTLYRNQYQQSTGNLICDQDLKITTRDECDLRDQHRVRFGVCVDLTLLPRAAIKRLCQYPRALVKIIGSMNELLRAHPDFSDYGDKDVITEIEFSDIHAVLTGYTYDNGRQGRDPSLYNNPNGLPLWNSIDPRTIENYRRNMIRMQTVMTSQIVAHRQT